MRKIIFASTNPIKLEEAKQIIPEIQGIRVDMDEIQSPAPEVVVRNKLEQVVKLSWDDPVIVEDTGLEIDSWNSLPGALVKWFVDGMGAQEIAHITALKGERRGADAVSSVGIAYKGEIKVWTDRIRGKIVAPRGELGGWTPIFEVEGSGKTLAEMSLTERMSVTMRRRPLENANAWLNQRPVASAGSCRPATPGKPHGHQPRLDGETQ
ncbi:non-canonical purine NTP pyrophosphatase [Streptomyces sp. NPDC059398]|uniref:non-canonical purine NTP pyrophosphatase n=1 Tax=Streptomyces sp. NPDC059398 TaxID=3346820 RepID=UPI0036AE7579